MKFQNSHDKIGRRASGTFMIFAALVAILVLLPITVAGFEMVRVNLMQKQLRVSTDSAALTASLSFNEANNSKTDDEALEIAKQDALELFKKNTTCGGTLTHSRLVDSIGANTPGPNECILEVSREKIDHKEQFVVTASYGYTPAFGAFLGLSTTAVTSTSKAALGEHKRDIVVVFDCSGSMNVNLTGEPMNSAKSELSAFLKKLHESGGVHLGLITFAMDVAGHKNASANLRRVELDRDADKLDETVSAVSALYAEGNTNTDGGLREALKMLRGSAHRQDAEAIIVLVSDGMPNHYYGGSGPDEVAIGDPSGAKVRATQTAKEAGQEQITVHSLGFFHTPEARSEGVQFMDGLKTAAGGESQAYTATTLSEFHQCLDEICNAALGLVN